MYGDSARYDLVHFFADKPTYRQFALLLLAVLFHPNRHVTLHLSHPETVITSLRIECVAANPMDPRLSGLACVPAAYGYTPSPVEHLHPLCREEWRIEASHGLYGGRAAYMFPYLHLTNSTGGCGSDEEFAKRSVLEGFGGPQATATFAALLLDISQPQTDLREFCLESPSGNWSVAVGGAEARLWIGYDYYMGEELASAG